MLVFNISWRQHTNTSQLYGHISDISTILRECRIRFAGHYWRAKTGNCKRSTVLDTPAMEQDMLVTKQSPTLTSYVTTNNATLIGFRP